MKVFSKFDAFKLNKVQMNTIAGGKVTKIRCRVTLPDGEEYYFTDVAEMTIEQANASIKQAYGAIGEAECFEMTYV